MIRVWLSLIVMFSAAAAAAQPTSSAEKSCIFAAAQRLPPIPGLVITGSRVSGLPAEFKGKGKPDMVAVLVEIDARAAAQDATFLFLCSTAPGRPFFADSIGLAK